MNSSTSSFRDELKVIATVLVVVAVWEIASRIVARNLDSDRRHIYEFPAISRQIHSSSLPRVLFIGNSLTRHGVKEEVVLDEFRKNDFAQASVARIAPVATAVLDWRYLYSKYFVRPEHHPDVIVIGFLGHHVRDGEMIKLARLSYHFLATEDMGRLWMEDLSGYDDRVKALLCHFSLGLGDQPEHKYRIFDLFIAKFREGERRIGNLLYASFERQLLEKPMTYNRLTHMAQLLKKNRVIGVFVAMPQPEGWDLSPAIPKTLESCGMIFIDARKVEGITPEDYSDGYHLGESGAEKYSRFIAGKLSEILKASAQEQPPILNTAAPR